MEVSQERKDADELQTLSVTGDWIGKPVEAINGMHATHIKLQAVAQNIRYTIDNSQATATHGFQLAAGEISFIPISSNGVNVFEETAGIIVQYQMVPVVELC